jgi:HD superfamily phosphohydrolase
MYRQVYLHKAARAAEVMMQALFRRLLELDTQAGTPPVLEAMLRGREVSTREYLELDDHSLAQALFEYGRSQDPTLADLATRLRHRRLYKTQALRDDADSAGAEARLREALGGHEIDAEYLVAVDRRTVQAYVEDHALVVIDAGGRAQPLLEASPLLRGLSRETFVHHRAVFPDEHREQAQEALRGYT